MERPHVIFMGIQPGQVTILPTENSSPNRLNLIECLMAFSGRPHPIRLEPVRWAIFMSLTFL